MSSARVAGLVGAVSAGTNGGAALPKEAAEDAGLEQLNDCGCPVAYARVAHDQARFNSLAPAWLL